MVRLSLGTSEHWGDVFNPATGAVAARVALATPEETRAAIHAARVALPAWAETAPVQRARVFFRFKALLEKHSDDLARLITTRSTARCFPMRAARVTRGIEVVEFACGIPQLAEGRVLRIRWAAASTPGRCGSRCGVCAGITPFNFPAMVPLWMFPIAMACGNTFVLKPSEKDPGCALRLAQLLTEAGLPAGVFNVVNGDRVVVDTLLSDPDVAAVSFVGSTPVAEYVYQTASAHGKRVQALGGAKNHMIVMPDADAKQAAQALMGAAYGSAGERCMAISVAVAVGDAGDRLVSELNSLIEKLDVGDGMREGVEMGPLVTREHLERVQGYIELGVREGAKLVADGREQAISGHPEGFYLGPCLFDHVRPGMRIYKEEIFGPVLAIVRVPDFEQALHLVNAHDFGNGTAIFTRDGGVARRFCHAVQAGMVGVNVPIPVPMAFHSFGGWKRSSSAPCTCTAPTAYAFTLASKPSPPAGPTALPKAPTSSCQR